ncbi:MAG: ATP synthase F0 subunit B [Deltaproteobacteria bacterium]|nr:ATP synthase F0 subunit B [Deltaproteobacteria bacterium]
MAGSQHASGGGVNVDFDKSVILQFIAFIVLFIIIKPLLLDPFLKMIEEREKRTEGAKTDARTMDERAGEIFKRYESELDKVRKVAAEERETLRVDGQKLEARMLEETRLEAARIAAEGKAAIAKEADDIRIELGKSSGAIATEIVGRVLGRGVS